ncbi:MAG: Asp23/Gls24 family envelope stress response protein [Candidatus Dormibacteraeota bacterium]|uniref:Asp23/Gls24 family envelope stress response protein n=1 Tax=Candidatus Dormiibacter inghamiae TaxID=3127013 RepID=A0A934NE29_9BACT|nr:Asp23/Gls24 family envelope stress response protein [Candidatus Dormibacteraeota bacterium]
MAQEKPASQVATTTPSGTTADAGSRSPSPSPSPSRSGPPASGGARHASLETERGNTRIADGVVLKIAALAAREIPGVHEMGKGFARAMGGLRARVPGQQTEDQSTQGVSVEVGERQAAIDLDIVTYYGQSIVEVTEAVRRNVIERIEGMTGLQVTEVNIMVDDLFVEGEAQQPSAPPRVQ